MILLAIYPHFISYGYYKGQDTLEDNRKLNRLVSREQEVKLKQGDPSSNRKADINR